MSELSNLISRYKRITNNINADDVPIYVMKKVVDAYDKAIDDFERIMCEELKDYMIDIEYMPIGTALHKFTRELAESLKNI